MNSVTVDLYQAEDAEAVFAIRLPEDPLARWRAQKGVGGEFSKIWTVEFQCEQGLNFGSLNWEKLLDRAIEAYQLSDPVVTISQRIAS